MYIGIYLHCLLSRSCFDKMTDEWIYDLSSQYAFCHLHLSLCFIFSGFSTYERRYVGLRDMQCYISCYISYFLDGIMLQTSLESNLKYLILIIFQERMYKYNDTMDTVAIYVLSNMYKNGIEF